MPAESVKLASILSLLYASDAAVTVTLETDLPAAGVKETFTLPPTGGKRQQASLRIQSTTRARQMPLRIQTAGKCYLYSGALWARRLGRTASDWGWHPIAINPSDDLLEIKIPIPATSERAELKMPIPATSERAELKMPIPATSERIELRIPVPPSDEADRWAELAMDE